MRRTKGASRSRSVRDPASLLARLTDEDLERLATGLSPLERGYRFAELRGCDLWHFAVSLEELIEHGLDRLYVQLLLDEGHMECRSKQKAGGGDGSTSELAGGEPRSFASLHVLTLMGVALVEQLRAVLEGQSVGRAAAASSGDRDPRPSWDSARRCLFVDGVLVKRFPRPAPNQALTLGAFVEEGWPTGMDDPLPFSRDVDRGRRLAKTAASLSKCQEFDEGLLFHTTQSGTVIYWEIGRDLREELRRRKTSGEVTE